ncbi:MAG TPA: IclR family transcriptional regulator C-terminal domain-containing protein [Mycobacteriales bacterium]|jgi:acetyl-CoA synthetase
MVSNDHRTGSSRQVVALAGASSDQSGADQTAAAARGLSTARAVLKVLSYMALHPEGVSARDVAAELGKSVSTAYGLLASLDEEGFAYHQRGCGYQLRAGAEFGVQRSMTSDSRVLSQTVNELFARTRKRCYLARVEAGAIVIIAVSGRQGIPRVPGLEPRIGGNAHTVAMGKVVLSLLPEGSRRRYIERGLWRYTPHTIASTDALMSELEKVRRNGFAVDRGEFDAEFCTIAAPILDARGRFLAVLGLSTLMRRFEAEAQDLLDAVREIAAAAGGGSERSGPRDDLRSSSIRRSRAA